MPSTQAFCTFFLVSNNSLLTCVYMIFGCIYSVILPQGCHYETDSVACSGGSRGGARRANHAPPPLTPLFWVRQEEMTEGKMACRASTCKSRPAYPPPPPSLWIRHSLVTKSPSKFYWNGLLFIYWPQGTMNSWIFITWHIYNVSTNRQLTTSR